MVLGSGRTCPHDLRFLVVFLSDPAKPGDSVSSKASKASNAVKSSIVLSSSLTNDSGVMMSRGFMPKGDELALPSANSEVYSSAGSVRNDSAGEGSKPASMMNMLV